MHKLLLLLALGACDNFSVGDIGVSDSGSTQVGFASCVVADYSSLSLSGDEPYGEVQISIDLDDCIEPVATFEGATLDDPRGAFSIAVPDAPELGPDSSVTIGVTLVATEPGLYEAQLEVRTTTFEPSTLRVQLFAEIPER